jgi:hypothetical protein
MPIIILQSLQQTFYCLFAAPHSLVPAENSPFAKAAAAPLIPAILSPTRRRFSRFPPFTVVNPAALPVLPATHLGGNFAHTE